MAGFLYETHMHTSESSACGKLPGADMARAFHALGYTGILVTDHFFNGNCAVDRSLPWEEKVHRYMAGYRAAKAEGDRIGLQVFFGIEYGYHGADMLTYGLDEDWLLRHPDVDTWDIGRYSRAVHEAGGLISHAHPFRQAYYLEGGSAGLYPDWIDAVEVLNSSHKDPSFDARAEEYRALLSLPATCGSDAHWHEGARLCAMRFPRRLADIHDFIDAVRFEPFDPVVVQERPAVKT